MKKFIIVIGASLLLMLSNIALPSSIHAEKNLEDVQDERKSIKEDLSDAEKEVADILIEIDEMNSEIAELDSILKANKEEIEKAEKEITVVEKEIKKLEKKIEERFDILKERAQSYQKNGGNIGFLDVIFNAKDFNEFISRVSAVNKITDADADLIEEQEKDKLEVEKKLKDLEEIKEDLKAIEKNIKDQKANKEDKKQELNKKKEELNSLVEELEIKDEKLSSLEAKIITERNPKITFSADSGNGQLGWPTSGGYISSPMGSRWGKTHKGIDIARTDRSTSPPIYAAESGTVETAGTISGYGNAVIINHGNGLKTLYGHMSSLNVKSGQSVKRGQQIGVMGSTGRSTGIHLHFEVHKNGSIQNPVGYLN